MGGRFVLNGRMSVTPGAVMMIPLRMGVLARPGEGLLGRRLSNRQNSFVCCAGRQIEDVEVSFAVELPLPAVPRGVKIDNPQFTYGDYRLGDRTLKIRRVFESHASARSARRRPRW
jgi:hypothetical protein